MTNEKHVVVACRSVALPHCSDNIEAEIMACLYLVEEISVVVKQLLSSRGLKPKVVIQGEATRWLSWYGVGLASADRLPVVVRIPAGPLGSLKCDPPKGNGR